MTKREIADAFGQEIDPLEEHAETFEELDIDPFEVFLSETKEGEVADNTLAHYRGTYRQWREYMDEKGRHPACPNEQHVKGFVEWLEEEKGNDGGTIGTKLTMLGATFKYWQRDAAFPHPSHFNPIQSAKSEISLSGPGEKEFPEISVSELRNIMEQVTNVRDRAIIVMQLKLGLRASELSNIKLEDINIANPELRKHYPNMGSHRRVNDRDNSIYIPHDREGNKSKRPRVLPLDDETRMTLLRYLLIRPDNGEPWLFLSTTYHEKITKKAVNSVWKDYFQPEYDETDRHKGVTSHFGRHFFTSWFKIKQEMEREKVKYMRGDTVGNREFEAIDHYLHTYYSDIEEIYRERIFKLIS